MFLPTLWIRAVAASPVAASPVAASPVAASPVAELRGFVDAELVAPRMAVACTPLSGLVSVASALPLPPPIQAELSGRDGARFWLDLLSPDAAAAAGFDLDGAVAFGYSDAVDSMVLRIPFKGDDTQVAALLDHAAPGRVQPRADGWTLTGQRGGEIQVQRIPTGLRVAQVGGVGAGAVDRSSAMGMVDGLPDAQGCAVWMASADARTAQEDEIALSASLPFSADGSYALRVKGSQPPPDALSRAVGRPISGSSIARPNGVLVVSAPLVDLIEGLPAGERLPAEEIATVERFLRLDHGLTLAVYGDPRALDLAVTVPVKNGAGRPPSARRTIRKLRRALERESIAVDVVSRTAFRTLVGDRVVLVSARAGLIAFGTNASAVGESIDGLGTPWIDPGLSSLTDEWPVVARFDIPGGAGRARGAVRSRDGFWDLEMALVSDEQAEPSAERQAALTGMLAAVAVPNFVELRRRARRVEAPETVDAIAESLTALRAAGTAVGALPVVPREAAALTTNPIHWSPSGPWAELGLPEKELLGSYWVEIDDMGLFTVHGVIDVDGDGLPAHFQRVEGHPTERLTDPSLY